MGRTLYCSRPVDALGISLIEGLDDAVVVTDATLNVIAWNGAMERLTGVARRDAMGRPAGALLAFLRDVDVAAHLAQALGGVRASTADVRFDVGERGGWLDARYAPWHANGRVAGVVGCHVDVTERRQRAAFVRALEAIAQSLTSTLDLDEVLDTIVTRSLEVMRADSALVVSWDGKAPEFTVMRAAGRLSDQYAAHGRIPAGGGPISRAILEATVVTTSNILEDDATWLRRDRRAQVEREGFKAVAAAPLRSKGRVHGALIVHYWTARTFDTQDVAAVRLLAEHAALAIDDARLYAEATARAARLRELAELEQHVSESLVVDDVLRRIARATVRLLNATLAQVWTADPARRTLQLSAFALEPGSPDVSTAHTLTFGEGDVGRTAATKTPIYVADAVDGPVLCVPIVSGDDLLGVLAVRSGDGALASDENRALVTAFAARAAVAMQHARTYAEAVRRAARLRDLVAVSHSITGSLDSSDVMQRIARAAAAMTPAALAAVHLFDPVAKRLRATGMSAGDWDGIPPEHDAGEGLPGLVVEARGPVLIPQPLGHPRTLAPAWWRRRPRASYYGVPINVGDTFVGVLDYILPEGLPDTEEQEALRLLAAQAGIAIRNASLFQAARVQAERIRTLAGVNQRLSGALELDDLLRAISESAAQITGVRFVSFWLADEHARTLSFVGGSVPEIAADFPSPHVSYDSGGIGWVARHRQTLVVDDVRDDDRILAQDWWRRWNLRAYAACPVVAGDQLLAILSLTHPEPIAFTDELRDMIEMFVAQAAVAVHNARLYEEARRRRDVAERLASVARQLTSTLEEERIAELVAEGVVELLGTRGATLYRYEAETGRLTTLRTHGPHGQITTGLVLEPGEGVAGLAVAERKIIATSDVLREPRVSMSPALRARLVRYRGGAVVSVPLTTHDQIIGALSLSDVTGREFTADELQTLQVFADQAALALENARLYASAQDSLVRLRDTQAQLVQAAKMSAVGQLVSGVAHELNNPLSVIIGYGQLLLGREVPADLKRPVELMVSQGERMSKIVRNLLYVARQRPPERTAVDLRQVMERTLALRINQLTLSSIRVHTEFADDVPVTTGDAQQLEQVFLNLLLNAEQAILEARAHGEITLRTRLRADGAAIIAEVIDDGPGIPPESLSRVFEPFYTTKMVGSGTGLGLSVSYGIVHEHGGRLSAASEPGRTVFALELPVVPPPAPEPVAGERRVGSGAGKMALVVEDEPAVRDLIVTLLADSGWHVDVASGGRAALEHLRRQAYDLVVSDMRMPEGDGEELYRSAVAHAGDYRARFIFITGDTAGPRAWDFLEGADAPVVEKPFRPSTLQSAVDRVASASR
ncbi:MAG TPA: GAF domain-containing protein [Methylomirabilota bacterium]|nr:GAF domain-containing protein [Methylomirabilota bacterium]